MTILTCVLSLGFFSATTFAVEAEGTIDEIRGCGLGNDWKHALFFKLSNGQWFSIFAKNQANDLYDDPYTFSLITTAYTSRLKVKVNFTHPGSTACGLTSVAARGGNTNDYISLIEYE